MTSPAFTILEVNHTGLTVRDLDASLTFWRDVLGFRLMYRTRYSGTFAGDVTGVPGAEIEVAALLAPGHKIELMQYHAPADRAHLVPRPCDIGSVHLAFDVDNLDAAMARIAGSGWHAVGTPQLIDSGPRHGTRVVYVRDPDGASIALMQPPMV